MEYELIPSKFFLGQLEKLSRKAKKQLAAKLKLVKENLYRHKRIKGHKLFLFRIRFENERREKRLIYLVEKPKVKLLCILDRDKEYKDLEKYLNLQGYK